MADKNEKNEPSTRDNREIEGIVSKSGGKLSQTKNGKEYGAAWVGINIGNEEAKEYVNWQIRGFGEHKDVVAGLMPKQIVRVWGNASSYEIEDKNNSGQKITINSLFVDKIEIIPPREKRSFDTKEYTKDPITTAKRV